MKYFLLLFVTVLCYCGDVQGQNLVPNPSFEDTVGCPDDYTKNFDQVTHAKGWSSFSATSDYFNSCAPNHIVNVPVNLLGYQNAASGKAYCGIFTYEFGFPNYREYIGAKLFSPLISGNKYYFKMKVSLADSSNSASNNIGVTFTNKFYTIVSPMPLSNEAKIYSHSIIKDTANWITVSGSFIADSSYKYVVIGNFFTDNLTDTVSIAPANSSGSVFFAYYYIDDVYVSTDSLETSIDNLEEEKTITYPNPASDIINVNIESGSSYSIIDVLGIEQKINYADGKLNVSELPQGIYLLKIRTNNKTYLRKQLIIR